MSMVDVHISVEECRKRNDLSKVKYNDQPIQNALVFDTDYYP